MFIDSHTHQTPFSNDASQTIWQLLAQADKAGLAGVCTTEHYEKDVYYDEGREDIFDLDEYFERLLPIKESRQNNAAKLFLGVELGYLPHLADHFAQIVQSYPFDSIILSLHILNGEDPFTDASFYHPGKIEVYSKYLKTLAQMARNCPDFDILGHYDYIARYSHYPDRKMRYSEMPDAFDELLVTLVDLGKSLEINTRTTIKLRKAGYPVEDAWPDPAIIKRYLSLGGNLVSLGSDAHNPQEAGNLINETAGWLKTLGINQLVHFEKRQPVFTSI